MKKQLIIAISREFSSGGLEIATLIAKYFDLPLYDKEILNNIAQLKKVDVKSLEHYDEKPRNFFTSRKVRGFNNSPEENIAQMQFQYLTNLAKQGNSFVVVGRCGDEILKKFKSISIFISADLDFKKKRILKQNKMSEKEALELMENKDDTRRNYHNHYCRGKWGESCNYDLCINSAKLGIEGTVKILIQYIKERHNLT